MIDAGVSHLYINEPLIGAREPQQNLQADCFEKSECFLLILSSELRNQIYVLVLVHHTTLSGARHVSAIRIVPPSLELVDKFDLKQYKYTT